MRLTGAYGAGSGAEGRCQWERRGDRLKEKGVSRKALREAPRETREDDASMVGTTSSLSRKCRNVNKQQEV